MASHWHRIKYTTVRVKKQEPRSVLLRGLRFDIVTECRFQGISHVTMGYTILAKAVTALLLAGSVWFLRKVVWLNRIRVSATTKPRGIIPGAIFIVYSGALYASSS